MSKKADTLSNVAVLAGQGGGQVEAEAVDVQVGDPVAQGVHHQLQGDGVARVERVAAAGGVDIDGGIAGLGPVVGRVVDAAKAEGGAVGAALGGVVEDHVQDHLQAGPVQGVNHGLELADLAAWPAGPGGGGVAVVGGEEADGVIAPVVGQPPGDEKRLGDALVHRQQLQRGHAQAGQVGDGDLVRQAGVRAALVWGNARVAHGEALDVNLVDHRVRVRVRGAVGVPPPEPGVHHHAAGHVGRRVQPARLGRVILVLAEQFGPEPDRSADGLGVGVK